MPFPGPARTAALAVAMVAILLAGCSGPRPSEVVEETAENLAEIMSGVLSLEVTAGRGEDVLGGSDAGFELAGPFSFRGAGPLPVAQLEYTRLRGGERTAARLVSTGHRAYVHRDGALRELPSESLERLELDPARDDDGFGRFDMERWLDQATVTEGPSLAGVATHRIRGRADVAAALADVLALARQLGVDDESGPAALARLADPPAEGYPPAVVDILTGRSDRLLRRLSLSVVLDGPSPGNILEVLGVADRPAWLTVELRLEEPNRAVGVAPPPGA